MKMKIAVIALSVLVTGCGVSHDQLRTENRQNLLKLSVGMTKQEAMNIMGTKTSGTEASGVFRFAAVASWCTAALRQGTIRA